MVVTPPTGSTPGLPKGFHLAQVKTDIFTCTSGTKKLYRYAIFGEDSRSAPVSCRLRVVFILFWW